MIVHNGVATVESEQTFDTASIKPTVTALPGGSDGEGGYTLTGIVNPNNSKVTNCEFKWGPDSASYAFKADCSPKPGEKGQPVTVEAHLTGLNPGSVYHANLFATNAEGTEESKDFEFTPTLAEKGPECPNEELRNENDSLELPECRAYEMVTDPNKQGASASFGDFNGGDAVAYVSAAPNLANSGQGPFYNNNYVATRTVGGWQTIPNLNGPTGSMHSAPEFTGFGDLLNYSADLLSSLWKTNKEGGPEGPYLRRPDGAFVRVGVGSPTDCCGRAISLASDDLSHWVLSPPSDKPITWGLGVYEFVGTGNDQPRRVDVDNSGTSVCGGPSHVTAVSGDGRVIVFEPTCSTEPSSSVWARVDGTTSYDLSASHCDRLDCNAPTDSSFQGMSKDGSRVYFTTTQQLVNGDTDETKDLYACDIPTTPQDPVGPANVCAALHLVSAAPGDKADVQQVLRVSDDGSTAYFTAKGVLADNEDALDEKALPGDRNLYAWRSDAAHPAGQTTFVVRLPESDSLRVQATPDGRYLALQTAGQLLVTDTDEATDIYRYDVDGEEMARVSTAVSGAGGNGEPDATIAPGTPHNSHPAISDDGQLIVFATGEALSPHDGNDELDAYLWNDGHALGSVAPLLEGEEFGTKVPGQVAIDGSGQNIYIQTAARLTPTDGDFAADVYDARIGGGFSQYREGCAGAAGACQSHSSGPMPPPAPATAQSPADPGNVKPSKPCPKGKVRKKNGKCVKKHTRGQKHKKSHKRTGHKRGDSK